MPIIKIKRQPPVDIYDITSYKKAENQFKSRIKYGIPCTFEFAIESKLLYYYNNDDDAGQIIDIDESYIYIIPSKRNYEKLNKLLLKGCIAVMNCVSKKDEKTGKYKIINIINFTLKLSNGGKE